MRLVAPGLVLFLTLGGASAAPAAVPAVHGIPLEEGQEVPPTSSAATGVCVARLNAAQTELRVICTHDVASPTGAHIHNAAPGVNGPIVFPFASPASPFRGVWALAPSDVADLEAGDLYVNVHSPTFPGGEIRGQILSPAARAFEAVLEEGQEVPPTGSLATGGCDAVLDAAETELTTACFHDVASPTGAHIHSAPPGVNGSIVFPFASPATPFLGVWALGAGDLDDLNAGNLYVNVHSPTFPGGEIRGQLFQVPLFEDGFESGDVSGWSVTVADP